LISVIIPVLNEEKVLKYNSSHIKDLAAEAEIIFVDGGSDDRTIEIAQKLGKIVKCSSGRAGQMNAGVEEARGDIFLFLHADSFITPNVLTNIKNKISQGYIGGGLAQQLDNKKIIYRLIEGFGNVRAQVTKVFYGDQGIFVKKDVFERLGGFPEVPVMEDILFTKKLRRAGKLVVLKDKIYVSSRRWETQGIIKTALLYSYLNMLFHFGVGLDKIKRIYTDLR